MSYIIPIKASLTNTDELSRVLSGVKAKGLDVSVQVTNSSGLAMDTATVGLFFELAKVTVPALITALAFVWVEHLKSKKKTEKPEHPRVTLKPTVVIETDAGNIRIAVDTSNIQSSVTKVSLPKDLEEITQIRLEEEYA